LVVPFVLGATLLFSPALAFSPQVILQYRWFGLPLLLNFAPQVGHVASGRDGRGMCSSVEFMFYSTTIQSYMQLESAIQQTSLDHSMVGVDLVILCASE
jgi:hypothetical protein